MYRRREASDWILSDDEHGLEGSCVGSLQHLDEGRPFVSWKFAFPLFRDLLALCAAGDGLCSGKKFGDGSHFDRALVVIFFGERGKATARLIQLPCQKKEIEEGYRLYLVRVPPSSGGEDYYHDAVRDFIAGRTVGLRSLAGEAPAL